MSSLATHALLYTPSVLFLGFSHSVWILATGSCSLCSQSNEHIHYCGTHRYNYNCTHTSKHTHTHVRARTPAQHDWTLTVYFSSALMSNAGQAVQQSYLCFSVFACLHWKLWANANSPFISVWFDEQCFTLALLRKTGTLKKKKVMCILFADFFFFFFVSQISSSNPKRKSIICALDGAWVDGV